MCTPLEPVSPAEQLSSWLLACAQGNQRAFRRLHDATARRLHAEVQHVLVDRGRSDEALQETYLKVWRHAARYRPEQGSAMTWLLRVARHTAIDIWRACHAEQRLREPLQAKAAATQLARWTCPAGGPDQTVLQRQRAHALRRGLDALSPALREAGALALLRGQAHPQIAQLCGISTSAARFRVERAARKLGDMLAGR